MTERVSAGGLQVDRELYDFIEIEALPGTGLASSAFWNGFGGAVSEFAPRNRALVAKRDALQTRIDAWHKSRVGQRNDPAAYKAFLREIGYLVPEGPDFSIDTPNVDAEFSTIAGPQLVVPVMNARYALNAANARWGSLYDALYGTDAMGSTPEPGGYDPERGAEVIGWAKDFLNDVAPLDGASHADVIRYAVADGQLAATLGGGGKAALAAPGQFVGYSGDSAEPHSVLLKNNNLHIDILIDPHNSIGKDDPAGVADLVIESAITTIMDCEDSVAAVDASDKVLAYRNWLGLMKGDLIEEVAKGGHSFTRRLNPDRSYSGPDGSRITLPGRSSMLVRNVGALMTNPAILLADGSEIPEEIPEEIMDAVCTSLIALHDIRKTSGARNSRTGSAYIVKPKMHGPEEVACANDLMGAVENLLGMSPNTLKIGIMDEERRTTVNLKECIRAAKSRVAFINTGFLDRALDRRLRGQQCRYRSRLRPEGRGPDRQGHVGHAGHDGGYAGAENRPPAGRGQHRLGTLANRGGASRHPLSPDRRGRPPVRSRRPPARLAGRYPDHPPGKRLELVARRSAGRTRQQRPGHPWLCRALGRSGCGLLEGAGHRQCRPDGGPGNAADLVPAHRQLAAARRCQHGSGDGDAEAHGRRGRQPERWRPALYRHGARL
jgi:malate synthase